MPSFTKGLDESLHKALALAGERRHEYATVEHLLLALIEDRDAVTALKVRNIDIARLRGRLISFIDTELADVTANEDVEARPTASFQRVIQRAVIHVQSSGRDEVTGADALRALCLERETYAHAFLAEQADMNWPEEPETREAPIHEILHPAHWAKARGYANGVLASGRMLFVGGQVGWNAAQEFETDEFAGQVRQTLENIVTVLTEAGARPEHLVRLTWYVTDREEYLRNLKEVGAAYRDVIGRHFPAMTLVQVAALVEDGAKVEIEATAVIPDTV